MTEVQELYDRADKLHVFDSDNYICRPVSSEPVSYTHLKEAELDSFIDKQIKELERVSGYTVEEAKALLLSNLEKEIRHDASIMIKDIETKAKDEADKRRCV